MADMEIGMVALSIFITGILFIILALIYGYMRVDRHSKEIAQQLQNATTEIINLRHVIEQKTEEVATLQKNLDQTFADPITHLIGWQLFENRIDQHLKESERHRFTMGLMFIDIDNFKVINDALGFEIGDLLLRDFAIRLEESVRQVDSISRLTKDTFVILLTQLSKPETAAIVAQRILQSLIQPFQLKEHELHVTACIGIALYPQDAKDQGSLMQNADYALHLAKKAGTNVCRFYEEKMHIQSHRELTLYNSLNKETIFDEFSLLYESTKDLSNNTIFSVDAILEWCHPELGLISREDIVEYAEKQRKLNALSIWQLEKACKQFLKWRAAGFQSALLGISLSIKQLENSSFVYQISHVLQGCEFNPEWLLIEIKENFLHVSLDVLEKAFNMLNYLGIKIAIDDFGAGSFTLRYLKSVTVHYLKLDRVFVEDIVENAMTRALVTSMLSLAQNMSMQVIAQDVENSQQAKILADLGCHLIQGPYVSLPLSGSDVIEKLSASIE